MQDQLHFIGRAPALVTEAAHPQRHGGVELTISFFLSTRRVFARLGVFASSFTLAAAEAVCARTAVYVHITTLLDHSLLVRLASNEVEPSRFRMLETLRLFALDRLYERGAGEADAARRSHAEFYRQMARTGGDHLWGPDERAWRLRLEAEEPNLHGALGWAEDNDPATALRLSIALWPYWDLRWGERKGVAYLDGVLSRPDLDVPDDLLAWGLTVAADLSANPGDAWRSVPWAEQAVALFRELGDDLGLRLALLALGSGLGNQGRLDEADAALAEAVELGRRDDDVVVIAARVEPRVVRCCAPRGNFERARDLNREEVDRWTAIGSKRGEATGLRHLAGRAANARITSTRRRTCCTRAIAIWTELDDPTSIAHVRMTLGDIARHRGDLDAAGDMYSLAMDGFEAVGDRRCTASTLQELRSARRAPWRS